jgi:hypothetical protein
MVNYQKSWDDLIGMELVELQALVEVVLVEVVVFVFV